MFCLSYLTVGAGTSATRCERAATAHALVVADRSQGFHDRLFRMHDNSSSTASPCSAGADTDYLSEVLRDLRISCASYCRTEFRAPWGVAVPAHQRRARFHYIAEGACWLCMPGRAPIRLEAGDLVLLPHGGAYALVDQPDTAARAFDVFPRQYVGRDVFMLREGGQGERCAIICTGVEFEESVVHPLLELMP